MEASSRFVSGDRDEEDPCRDNLKETDVEAPHTQKGSQCELKKEAIEETGGGDAPGEAAPAPESHDQDGGNSNSSSASSGSSIDWDMSSDRFEVKASNSYMLGALLADLKRKQAEEEGQQDESELASKRSCTGLDIQVTSSSSSAQGQSTTGLENQAALSLSAQTHQDNTPQPQASTSHHNHSSLNRTAYNNNFTRHHNSGYGPINQSRAERRARKKSFKRRISHGNQMKELFDAIGAGESCKVASILKTLKNNLNPNCRDLDVALAQAVVQENLFMVQNLIVHGATINTWILVGPNGKHCFHYAAEHGFVDVLELLASEFRAVINTIDEDGNTALILCQRGHCAAQASRVLLMHKAKIDVQNNSGETALMKAIQHQNITSVMHLAKAGANIHLIDQRGITAKSLAKALDMGGLLEALSEESHLSEADLSHIMTSVAPLRPSRTVSQDLAESLHSALWLGLEDKIPELLSAIPGEQLDFSKVMCVAAEAGKLSVYESLKSAYSDKFAELVIQEVGVKWLSLACLGDNITIVESLLDAGANMNSSDSSEGHPLVYSLSVPISELLLQRGALPDKASDHHIGYYRADTALKRAVINNNTDMVKLLRQFNATVDTSLIFFILRHCQCMEDMKKLIISFIEEINVNEADEYGRSGLIVAAQKGDLDLVKVLIGAGADVNFADENNNTSLIMAAKSDDGTILSYLIEQGAVLDSQNLEGQTAVILASDANNYDGFCCLVDAGANLNLECGNRTLLSKLLLEVSSKRKPEFILYLIHNGAKFTQYECNYAVHRSIIMREWDILYALVHGARIPPTLVLERSLYCMLKRYHFQVFYGVMSPLCMAVLCGYVSLARDMVESLYITSSDMNILPFHAKVREHLSFRESIASLAFLDELASNPPSLLQLTFANVSDSVGAEDRRDKVQQLGLPGKLERALMFEQPDQCVGDKAFEGVDHEEESYESDWAPEVRERRHRENQGLLWFGWVGRHIPHVYSPDSYNLPDT